MQRPVGIHVTASLMAANLIADVTFALTSPHGTAHRDADVQRSVLIFVHVLLVAFVVAQAAGVVAYWLGRSWARWAVIAASLYYLYALREVSGLWHRSHRAALLTLGAAGLAMFLLWYVHTSRVRYWFSRGLYESDADLLPAATER